LVVLKVSIKEKAKAIEKYRDRFGIPFPILMDDHASAGNAYGVWSHPGCAATKEGTASTDEAMPMQEGMAMMKTYPEDYVFPLSEINLEKVTEENRGMKILEENATTVRDYYKGGVQEKAEGEKLFKEGKENEALDRFEASNRFFLMVLRYLPVDDAQRNVYGDHVVIFLPNLISADNYLKLATLYEKMRKDDKALEEKGHGEYYLSQSLKSVKTEWAFQIQKEFEKVLPKK
jgi:hypothetical protein